MRVRLERFKDQRGWGWPRVLATIGGTSVSIILAVLVTVGLPALAARNGGGVALTIAAAIVAVVVDAALLVLCLAHNMTAGRGLLALTAAGAALAMPLAMATWTSLAVVWRLGICIGMLAAALACTASNWTRRSLRIFGATVVVAIFALVLQIGRETAPSEAAMRELAHASRAVTGVTHARDAAQPARVAALHSALQTLRFERAAPGVSGDVAARARQVENDVEQKRPSAAIGLDYAAFNHVFPTSASVADRNLRDSLAAVVAASTPEPSPDSVNASIANACFIARQAAKPQSPMPCTAQSADDALPVAMAAMRLQLATYRAAVLGRPEDRSAQAQAAKDLAGAQAGASSHDSMSVLGALQAGANAVLADLPWQHRDPPIEVQAFGWIVIVAAALGIWRLVERTSAQTMPGPVEVTLDSAPDPTNTSDSAPSPTSSPRAAKTTSPPDPPSGSNSSDSARLAQLSAFRSALLVNIPEPSSTPGGSALQEVTDLAEIAGPAGTAIGKVLSALGAIIAKPGGYAVTGDVISPPAERPNWWRVLVRVNDKWTGRQLAVRMVQGSSACGACRIAGYWAAAFILSRSSRIPDWATWDVDTFDALALFHEANLDSERELTKALRKAPNSGVLLVQLGNHYDEQGRGLDALTLHARAVTAHPNYFVAIYRLAISIATVGAETPSLTQAPLSVRRRVALEVERACRRLAIGTDIQAMPDGVGGDRIETTIMHALERADPAVFPDACRVIAVRLLVRLSRFVRRPDLLAQSFRVNDRDVALQWARWFGPDGQPFFWRWTARSARLLSLRPEHRGKALKHVEKAALHRRSSWQLSYNLACFYARSGQTEQALGWLEIALERPDSQLMTNWPTNDPDMASVRHTPRFKWVLSQVDDGQEL